MVTLYRVTMKPLGHMVTQRQSVTMPPRPSRERDYFEESPAGGSGSRWVFRPRSACS
jgi:hypothetical protein